MTRASRTESLRLAAVVPAAGLSRRMGGEKILLPFGDRTMLERVLETLRTAGVEEVAVVLRPDLPEAAEQARRAGAQVIWNPHPEEEMLTSVRLGLDALDPDIEAFFLWPADHPAVAVTTLQALARLAAPNAVWIPCYRSRRGHPALVGCELRDAIAREKVSGGVRELWRLHAPAVFEIDVEDPGVVTDLDTPEAYAAAIRRLAGSGPSSGPI